MGYQPTPAALESATGDAPCPTTGDAPVVESTTGDVPATGGGRIIAYCRVSTAGQAERETIETQLVAVEEWGSARGIRVDAVYRDEGISGAEGIDRRLGLASALADLQSGDTLLVYRLDRLARDLLLQETLLRDIWKKGASIASCSPAEAEHLTNDPSDPSRKLVRQIMGATAEYEKEMIRARTLAGRRRRQATGGFVGGWVPFGFQVVNGMLVEKASEVRLIREMERRKAHGQTFAELAVFMTEQTGETWPRARCFRVLRRYREEVERAKAVRGVAAG